MTSRTTPIEPLIVIGTLGFQAFDPTSGSLLWQLAFADHAITCPSYHRVARQGRFLVFANNTELMFVDAYTGNIFARHSLTFHVMALTANGPFVAASGPRGMACFHDGQLAWSVKESEVKSPSGGWLSSSQTVYNVVDPAGTPRQRLNFWPLQGNTSDLAIVLGGEVAQADRNT